MILWIRSFGFCYFIRLPRINSTRVRMVFVELPQDVSRFYSKIFCGAALRIEGGVAEGRP